MNLPEFGVKRPVTNLMIFLSVIIIALYSLSRLGIDMMPEIEPPALSVIAAYPGASPEDVEAKVTEPLENQLGTTPGIERITSRCLEGVSVVTLKFNWGIDLDEASNDVRDRIDLAKRFLPDIPDEMENPFIFKFNTAMIPILFVGITADETYPILYELVDKKVLDELKQIPGVGTVQLRGGLERQINIWIDRKRLEGYGFSILTVQNVLRQENISQPAGNIKYGLTDYLVRIPGEFASPSEINSVVLGKRNGTVVYLKDVATIEDGYKEQTDIVRVNEKSGLMLIVQKQTGTNTVEVVQHVKEKLDLLIKELPQDVRHYIIMDNSEDIVTALDALKGNARFGIILVVLVIWFFLRQFIPSLIISFTIPFSLLIAFIYLFVSGRTINIMSLSSLIIALGMVVDAAIVVVDNVYRHLEKGRRPVEAAIFGTKEVYLAIASSTLTTIVVFAPLLFIKGVVGIMFKEFSMIVIITLLGSMFTATTFTPMLCSKWLKLDNKKKKFKLYDISEKWLLGVEKLYSFVLGKCLKHRKFVILGFSGVFIFSILLFKLVGNEFLPEEDTGDVRATLALPIGTRVEETDKIARRIEKIFNEKVPEKRYILTRSGLVSGFGAVFGGRTGSHITSAQTKLVKKTFRKRSAKEVGSVVREEIKKIPGILKVDVSTDDPLARIVLGTGGKAIQIEIIGHSFTETDKFTDRLKEIVEKIPGAVDVTTSRELSRPTLKIEVDREKASSLGLNMSTIVNSVKTFIEGGTATKYRESGDTYDIYVRLEESYRKSPSDIENVSIVSPLTNKQIKLANIAKISETLGPEEIERKNRERILLLECNTLGRSMGKIVEDIKKELEKITIPSGITVNFGGAAEEQQKAFKDLFLLLILGIMLVYMVMAAQFESLLDPFIIMFAVPFTFTGVIFAFVLTKTTLSLVSFIGIVMLMGIVVNNAIVLISYMNILQGRGLSIEEAITTGGRDRLRPILMTTLTTIIAMVPMATFKGEGAEIWKPLGITMVGGLGVSSFITLFFVPTIYAIFESRRKTKRAV